MVGIMAFLLTACGNNASGNAARQEAESMSEIPERENDTDLGTVLADSSDNAQQEETDTDSDSNKEGNSILVAYFSLAGEQYGVGVIEEGNTSIIAKMIAEQTGADLFEIEAANAYPETYDGLLDVSRQEMFASVTYTSVLNANAYGARGTYRMGGTHWFEKREDGWFLINAPDC